MQPEPSYRQPKCERLLRRGPRDYFIVGKSIPEGRRVEIRLAPLSFKMGGPPVPPAFWDELGPV